MDRRGRAGYGGLRMVRRVSRQPLRLLFSLRAWPAKSEPKVATDDMHDMRRNMARCRVVTYGTSTGQNPWHLHYRRFDELPHVGRL